MFSYRHSALIAAGLLLFTVVAMAMEHTDEDILFRAKRDSDPDAEPDSDGSAYDNIFTAISEAGTATRDKRQNVPRAPRQQDREGRQANKIDGFPNGLPAQVPEGVRIALESAQRGPDGEFIMNPIPGQAGIDFPVLASVPQTGFNCNTQKFPGIYTDVDADCQVFHMCQPNGNSDSFLCPNGTVFNQQYFICDWWYNVDCAASPSFYPLNEFIYQEQEGKKCQSLFCIND